MTETPVPQSSPSTLDTSDKDRRMLCSTLCVYHIIVFSHLNFGHRDHIVSIFTFHAHLCIINDL